MTSSDTTLPKRKRRWLTCLGLIVGLLALFGCWFMIGLSFNFSGQSPLQSLETSRDKWDATGIDDYKMTLGFGSYNFVGWLHLTIHDDQIIEVAEYVGHHNLGLTTPVSQTETTEFVQNFNRYGNFPTNIDDYTIDNLFDFATQKLSNQPTMPLVAWCKSPQTRYETTFNEENGYLQSLRHTNCPSWNFGGGFMCLALHCSSQVRVTDFEPLP